METEPEESGMQPSLTPIQVMLGTKFASVSAGAWHTMAIDEEGNLWGWGVNDYGQLGNGTTDGSAIPIRIKSGTRFASASVGENHTMAIDSEGNLWGW